MKYKIKCKPILEIFPLNIYKTFINNINVPCCFKYLQTLIRVHIKVHASPPLPTNSKISFVMQIKTTYNCNMRIMHIYTSLSLK